MLISCWPCYYRSVVVNEHPGSYLLRPIIVLKLNTNTYMGGYVMCRSNKCYAEGVCVLMLCTMLMLVWHQFVTGELFVPDRRKELEAMKALSMFLCAERHLGSERTVKSSFCSSFYRCLWQ